MRYLAQMAAVPSGTVQRLGLGEAVLRPFHCEDAKKDDSVVLLFEEHAPVLLLEQKERSAKLTAAAKPIHPLANGDQIILQDGCQFDVSIYMPARQIGRKRTLDLTSNPAKSSRETAPPHTLLGNLLLEQHLHVLLRHV